MFFGEVEISIHVCPNCFWISIVHMFDVPKDTAAPARTQGAQFAWRISRMRWSYIFA